MKDKQQVIQQLKTFHLTEVAQAIEEARTEALKPLLVQIQLPAIAQVDWIEQEGLKGEIRGLNSDLVARAIEILSREEKK